MRGEINNRKPMVIVRYRKKIGRNRGKQRERQRKEEDTRKKKTPEKKRKK